MLVMQLCKQNIIELLINYFSPRRTTVKRKSMTYGIYVTKENFDIFEDGSKKRASISQGWYKDASYNSMKSAKFTISRNVNIIYKVTRD